MMEEFDCRTYRIRLRKAIERSGKDLQEIMAETGIAASTMYRQFRERRDGPSVVTLYKLCQALDVTAGWLIGLEDEP